LSRFIPILLLILSLLGCSQQPDGVLRMGLATAPTNLDPRFATDAASSRINRLLYQRLVDFDKAGMVRPSIGHWQMISPTRYRFTLRGDGDRFHNGVLVTADDVKATYDSVLDPRTASPHRSSLKMIERIEVISKQVLDFHLRRPDPLFPAYLVIGILPAEPLADGHPFATQPLGSGPFHFVSWPRQGELLLRRQRDGQQFEFLEVKDPSVRILKLLRNEIQLLQNDLPPELLGYLDNRQGIQIKRRPGSNFSYIGFNLEDPATSRLPVRRAVAHAIDRQAIIHHLMQGRARPAQAIFPPEHWAGNNALAGIEYDPRKARRLLAEAGYSDANPLKLVYKTSSDPFRVRLATVIQHQLSQVGIDVQLRSYDWGTFYGDIKDGRFQMYSLSWVGLKTPDIFRNIFHSSSVPPAGANRGRFRDRQTDALIETAEKIPALQNREGHYRELQQRLLEQLPYVPLWYEEHIAVSRDNIRGYDLATDGNYDGLNLVEWSGS
jgi:peptide/nickel transport system substrate-binding protein